MAARRVVVTGVGLVSPLAVGTEPTWRAVLAGRSGIAPITLFDASRYATRFAGEVNGFDPLEWLDKKDVKKCARFIQLALAGTSMAITASGLQVHAGNATRVGVTVGSGIGGFEVIEREHQVLLQRGPERVSPFFIVAALVNLAAGQVAVRFGAKGPNSAVATACTTGAHAIGEAFRLIQHGYADAMICGGTDAHHVTAPPEDGEGVARVMTAALEDAGVRPSEVQYLNAHATSTPLGDRAEATAIEHVFGSHTRDLGVSSTKSMTGHLLGAAGAVEAGLTVLALRDQMAPPTINLESPDADNVLNLVAHRAAPMPIMHAMTNSFGFGGTNASLIFSSHV
jgi:3-oxoacyl-(acyl-carrier-protein) synthase